MKRIVKKHWDPVNGRLTARYYQVYENAVKITQFESPLMMKNPEECKGNMSKVGDSWIGKQVAQELAEVFGLTTRKDEKVDRAIQIAEKALTAAEHQKQDYSPDGCNKKLVIIDVKTLRTLVEAIK